MKKALIISAFALMGVAAIAADIPSGNITKQEKTDKRNGVLMEDGTMYVLKDGTKSEMTKAVIMSNGTKVLANGEVYLKNGDKLTLSNGDFVSLSGKIEKKDPS